MVVKGGDPQGRSTDSPERKKKKKKQATLQGCNHGEVQDGGSDSVNQKGGFYLPSERLVSREWNFLWFLLEGAEKDSCVIPLIGQQRALFDNCTSWLQVTEELSNSVSHSSK